MGMIGQRVLERLFAKNQDVWRAVSANPSIPQSMKTMIFLHLQKSWIPNYLSLAIAPLRGGLEAYFDETVFDWNQLSFHYPSMKWWQSHADTSHPPQGAGCDPSAHENFLTAHGASGEFVYVAVLKNGDIITLERPDFEEECAFWLSGSGT